MKEIEVNKIKKINKSRYNAQFGVPLGGRGKLGADNIYIPKADSCEKAAKETKTEVKTTLKENEIVKIKEEPCLEEKAMVREEKKALESVQKKEKGLKVAAKKTVELFKFEDEERVISVNSTKKGRRLPLGTSMTVLFFSVLLMFVIINYVQIFENQTMINELKTSIEESKETERKLTAELEQKYDLSQIGDYASSELGMVGSENNKKVYIDIEEDDTFEVHEPETEDFGTIATVMNALGDTFKAWIDVFG